MMMITHICKRKCYSHRIHIKKSACKSWMCIDATLRTPWLLRWRDDSNDYFPRFSVGWQWLACREWKNHLNVHLPYVLLCACTHLCLNLSLHYKANIYEGKVIFHMSKVAYFSGVTLHSDCMEGTNIVKESKSAACFF